MHWCLTTLNGSVKIKDSLRPLAFEIRNNFVDARTISGMLVACENRSQFHISEQPIIKFASASAFCSMSQSDSLKKSTEHNLVNRSKNVEVRCIEFRPFFFELSLHRSLYQTKNSEVAWRHPGGLGTEQTLSPVVRVLVSLEHEAAPFYTRHQNPYTVAI